MARRAEKAVQFWSAILEEWQLSGVSLKQFARARAVGYKTLCRWKKKLLPEPNIASEHTQAPCQSEPENDFAPIHLIDQQEAVTGERKSTGSGSVVEIVLNCGRMIRASSECPVDFLRAVVSAVEGN
jgi:hypothetical protein